MKTINKFRCPVCDSGRTKPLPMAVNTGTRRRNTVGLSRRSVWTSTSKYTSDFVSSLPFYPSNFSAYALIGAGLFALLIALVANDPETRTVCLVLGLLVLALGFSIRKPQAILEAARRAWRGTWVCMRCGHQWLS